MHTTPPSHLSEAEEVARLFSKALLAALSRSGRSGHPTRLHGGPDDLCILSAEGTLYSGRSGALSADEPLDDGFVGGHHVAGMGDKTSEHGADLALMVKISVIG